MPRDSSGENSRPASASGCTPPPSPRPPSRGLALTPRRASSLTVKDDDRLSISTATTVTGTSTGACGWGGAGGKRKDVAGTSLAKEGYEAVRSPRGTRRTGTRLGRSSVGLLSAIGLLALASLRGTFRAAFSSSSSPRNRSTRTKTANQAILPTKVGLSPPQIDGVLTTPSAGDEDGAAAAAGVGGAASNGLREDASPSISGGGLGEGAARDGQPRCWTDEEGRGRCLPTVFFFGVSKCGTTSLSSWLAEHPRTVFAPPPKGYDFREAHVFDFSPKFWHEKTPRARRDLLSPVATPEDTVIDFTPNYSVVGETPLRISDFYGVDGSHEGRLRRELRFLVVLREPVARTISSWEYKSELLHQPNGTAFETNTNNAQANSSSATTPSIGFSAKVEQEEARSHEEGRRLLPQTATTTSRRKAKRRLRRTSMSRSKVHDTRSQGEQGGRRLASAEQRPLRQAFREGAARVERLAECAKNATENGLFGREVVVTFCRATKGPKQCNGHPPCELCNTHTEPWCNPREYLEEPIYNAHVGKSMYALQLRRWFSVFGRESFKVVFTEEMQADPVKTLTEVLDFLGLDLLDPEGEKGLPSPEMWEAIAGARYNTADGAKKEVLEPQVTPELREEMRAFFAPYNRDLEELLGVPLPKSWGVQA